MGYFVEQLVGGCYVDGEGYKEQVIEGFARRELDFSPRVLNFNY